MFSYEDWIKAVKLYANLVNQMLENALLLLEPGEHPIIHSDRGCHYRWPDWIHMVVQAGSVRSMSRKGCSPRIILLVRAFSAVWRTKCSMANYGRGIVLNQFMEILDNYLHWYNEKRIKLTLGGLSPVEYRQSLGLSLLRLCIFQIALKSIFSWYYYRILERAGKDMVSLGGYERKSYLFSPDRYKIWWLLRENTFPQRNKAPDV